jgi:ribonucleoside-triphosphate reductase (formate)
MQINVSKRDGLVQEFDSKRIYQAVFRAAKSAGEVDYDCHNIAELIKGKVAHKVEVSGKNTTVEDIQDMVEKSLMASKWKSVGKSYIEFRHDRDQVREGKDTLSQLVSGILDQTDEGILFENGNLNSKTLTTQRALMTSELSKLYSNRILPKVVVKNHEEGYVHFHDKNFSPLQAYTNCCLVDLKGMLEEGFNLGGAKIKSPKSIGVATAVTAQIIAQVSSAQYGGTSIANIDTVLEKYVMMNYDKHLLVAEEYNITDKELYAKKRTEKDVYDAFQALEYEINSLFNSHSQSPFTTVSFGMGTSWASRVIQEAVLNVRLKGLGGDSENEGITAIFPKLIFFIEEGLNLKPEDPNYDIKRLALKCAARRQYPDIISAKNNRGITGSSVPVTSMGCRSFLSVWKDENGEERLDGRNNLGVNSLNIPMISLDSNKDLNVFWELLNEKCEIAHEGLKFRVKTFESATSDLAPVLYQDGAFGVRFESGEKIGDMFRNGRSSLSLGYIGLWEAACYMFDVETIEKGDKAYQFMLDTAQFMKDKTEQWKKAEGYGYSLYTTPSEGYCSSALEKCKKKHGVVENVTDKDYFTNGFHVSVREKISPFDKIDFEAPFHWIANAGHISYTEFPDMKGNIEGLESVWDYAVEHLDYFGTNTAIDTCHECGFVGEMQDTGDGEYVCPSCGNEDHSKMQVCKRLCGYLGEVASRPVNKGKKQEIKERVKHL